MFENEMTQTWEKRLVGMAQGAWEAAGQPAGRDECSDEDLLLEQAYQYCTKMTAAHSRSFYTASALLPREKRRAVRALYAFCREADDIVDEEPDSRQEALRRLRAKSTASPTTCDDLIGLAWADVRQRYSIPAVYARQLLEGVEQDLYPQRYQTFEDLSVYCYRVASTVGLMSMHITGFQRLEAMAYAIKLGVALQLTNILRDIGEDWRSGRLYLPLDELRFFNLEEADLERACLDGRWERFMRFQIARARRIYREAAPGIALLNPDGRFAVRAAARLYEGILGAIEANGYDVFSKRAYVKMPQRLWILINAYRG
jgi:15-cis-phytoene synthase